MPGTKLAVAYIEVSSAGALVALVRITPKLKVTVIPETVMGIVCGMGFAAAKVLGPVSPWLSKSITVPNDWNVIAIKALTINPILINRPFLIILIRVLRVFSFLLSV
jgi:hypothetical protein